MAYWDHNAATNGLGAGSSDLLMQPGVPSHDSPTVRNRIIRQMRLHNGAEPDFVEENGRFVVRPWKEFRQA